MGITVDQVPNGLVAKGPTSLEEALYRMLEEDGLRFEKEYPVAGYYLDAFVPETGIGYEADGYPTHFTAQGRKRDENRDARIIATGRVTRILRFTKRDLEPWIE